MPYRAPRWFPYALVHLSQRISSKFGCDSGAPHVSDSRKDPSKCHKGARSTYWFSGIRLDDPKPGGGPHLQRRPAVSRPKRRPVPPEEATYLHSREKKAARPLHARSDNNRITTPQISSPRPSQSASYRPLDRPSSSSGNHRISARTRGAQQFTANATSGSLGVPKKRRVPIPAIPTVVVTPPLSQGDSTLPGPPGQKVEDRSQVKEARETQKGTLSPPLPEFAPGQPALERYINNMVSSASPLSLACLKLCESPVTYSYLRRSEVGIMVSIQLSAAGDVVRRQSKMPVDVWKLHTESRTWYAKYCDRIRAMEVLVEWIEQVSEHLNAGTVQPYAVVQTWEQLSAVGNLLSDVTVKLDHSLDRLERQYAKRVSSSTSPLPRESTATNRASLTTLDTRQE